MNIRICFARAGSPLHAAGSYDNGAHGVTRLLSFDSLGLPLKMTITAPDRPETGTKGKSSRARNISRRLQRFA